LERDFLRIRREDIVKMFEEVVIGEEAFHRLIQKAT